MNRVLRSYLLVTLLLTALLSSCGEKTRIVGREYVKRAVLVDVLVDMHLVDAITNDRFFYRKYAADSIDLAGPVFEKYGIDQQKFDTTLYAYSQHPDLLDAVYADVLQKLNKLLEENETRDEEVKRSEGTLKPVTDPPQD